MTEHETLAIDYAEATKRAKLYADTVHVDPPARLVGEDGAPAPELGQFCMAYGASLDWIFLGDVRGMIQDSFKLATGAMEERK